MGTNFIFVHVGENIPACSYITLRQARFMNEEAAIYFLLDPKNYAKSVEEKGEFFRENQVILVDLSKIPKTQKHRRFEEISPFDKTYKGGFWNHTTERFFHLHDFLEKVPLKNVIHMETDVMLYVDMKELLPFFLRSKAELAGTFQWTTECVPGFVFIQHPKIWDRFIDHLIEKLESYRGGDPQTDLNDMRTLASFKTNEDTSFIQLPVLMPEYGLCYEKREIKGDRANTSLEFLSNRADLFPGYLFDAAAFGIYANGYDKTVYPQGRKGDIHWKSLFDPSKLNFFWGEDGQGRPVPYVSLMGTSYRLANLHFHSKHPEGFTSFAPTREPLQSVRLSF